MKMEIINEKKNPVLKRDEHRIRLEHKGKATPSRFELAKEVSRLLKTKEDLIIIDKILSRRGKQESDVYVLSYKKTDDMPKYKAEKMKARAKEPKKAEAPAEEPKAEEAPKEKPAEEKAEEAPAEEKEAAKPE